MRFLALVASIAVVACAKGPESANDTQRRIDSESIAARRVIDSLNIDLSSQVSQGHGDLVAAQFAEDGELAVAGAPPASGRPAIATFITGLGTSKPQLKLIATMVVANGPVAVERGNYILVLSPPGATLAATEEGTYLNYWQRTPGGAWLRVTNIATTANPIPPAGAGTTPAPAPARPH